MTAIPPSVTELVDVLAAMPGAVAVVLGGSRALRSDDEGSDWDLGVYYRGEIVMEEGHAIVCERSEWVCNEKRLIETAGLGGIHSLFAEIPVERKRLLEWVDRVADDLGMSTDESTPWKRNGN